MAPNPEFMAQVTEKFTDVNTSIIVVSMLTRVCASRVEMFLVAARVKVSSGERVCDVRKGGPIHAVPVCIHHVSSAHLQRERFEVPWSCSQIYSPERPRLCGVLGASRGEPLASCLTKPADLCLCAGLQIGRTLHEGMSSDEHGACVRRHGGQCCCS